MKGFRNVFDSEQDFSFGGTSPAPGQPSSSGVFDAEPFNFHSPVSISGFGARTTPFDLKLGNTVGDGEVNEPKDVGKIRNLLTATGILAPGGRTKTNTNGDVNLGIFGLQALVGAKQDGYMRPGGETVANTMKSLFGAGAAKQRAPKPALTKLPAAGFPAKPMDVFAKASRASLASVPATRPIAKPPAIPSGPDGIVIGGTVMEQTKGLMKRIETLAPRGYRYFPKMGRMAAHWIDPGHLPISEAQVQRVMRRALAKPAAAPSRNATLGGDKVALPGQGGGASPKKPATGSEAATRVPSPSGGEAAAIGELIRTLDRTVLTPVGQRSWKLPGPDIRNREHATTIERIMRNINVAVEKATGGVGRILGEAGRGFGEAFKGPFGIGPETWQALVKFGMFRSNNTSIMSGVQAFNEALFEGGAIAGDLALRTLQAIEKAGIGAIVQFAREAGESETGARKLQRDLGVLAMIAGMVSGRNAKAFGRGANPRASRSAREVRTSKASPRNVVLSKRAKQILRLNKELSVPGRRPPTGGRIVPDNLKWLNSDTGVATGGLKGHAKNHPLAGNTDVENYRRQVVATIRFGNKIEKRHKGQIKEYYVRFFRMEKKRGEPAERIFVVTSIPKHGSKKGFTAREYNVDDMRGEFGWPPIPD